MSSLSATINYCKRWSSDNPRGRLCHSFLVGHVQWKRKRKKVLELSFCMDKPSLIHLSWWLVGRIRSWLWRWVWHCSGTYSKGQKSRASIKHFTLNVLCAGCFFTMTLISSWRGITHGLRDSEGAAGDGEIVQNCTGCYVEEKDLWAV